MKCINILCGRMYIFVTLEEAVCVEVHTSFKLLVAVGNV